MLETYSMKEVCDIFKVSQSTISRWVQKCGTYVFSNGKHGACEFTISNIIALAKLSERNQLLYFRWRYNDLDDIYEDYTEDLLDESEWSDDEDDFY